MAFWKTVTTHRSAKAALGIGLLANSATAVAEDFAKEGSFTLTMVADQTETLMEIGPKRQAYTYDARIVYMNDAGSGFLHKAYGRCLGSGLNTNAEGGNHSVGTCTLLDREGDTILVRTESGRTNRADKLVGVATFAEGTGKYAGIQGKYQYAWEWLKTDARSDTEHAISHSQGSYKIE